MDYKNSGVDIEAGYKSVELMKEHVKRTMRPEVLGGLGGFSGAFSLEKIKGMEEPTLVSGTDGCGTKVKLAFLLDKHDTIGIDCVAMCVNDIACAGGEPLFFLDYIACGKNYTKVKLAFLLDKHDTIGIDCVAMCVNDIACAGGEPLFFLDYIACGKNYPEKIATIVGGVAEGCVQSGCALIGGETAEHPGLMPEDEYDLAGFAVGVVDKKDIITGAHLKDGDVIIGMAGGETAEHPGLMPEDEYDLAGFAVGVVDKKDIITGAHLKDGDVIIGMASSGVHSNGFSLVRKIFRMDAETLNTYHEELGKTLGEALLAPTRIYVKALGSIKEAGVTVKACSHITGIQTVFPWCAKFSVWMQRH